MYSVERAFQSVNSTATDGSPVSPTDGIRPKVIVKRDESLAVQRCGQIDYLPFWRGVSNGEGTGTGNQRDHLIPENHRITTPRGKGKHTRDIRGPNPNGIESVRSDRRPRFEETFEGTTNIPSSCVDLSPCLPDVVVREFERFLRFDKPVTEELRSRTGDT